MWELARLHVFTSWDKPKPPSHRAIEPPGHRAAWPWPNQEIKYATRCPLKCRRGESEHPGIGASEHLTIQPYDRRSRANYKSIMFTPGLTSVRKLPTPPHSVRFPVHLSTICLCKSSEAASGKTFLELWLCLSQVAKRDENTSAAAPEGFKVFAIADKTKSSRKLPDALHRAMTQSSRYLAQWRRDMLWHHNNGFYSRRLLISWVVLILLRGRLKPSSLIAFRTGGPKNNETSLSSCPLLCRFLLHFY